MGVKFRDTNLLHCYKEVKFQHSRNLILGNILSRKRHQLVVCDLIVSTAEFDCRGVSLFPVRTKYWLVQRPMMGEMEGMKTNSKCQLFWNLRKRFSLEKSQFSYLLEKIIRYYIYLFTRENVCLLVFWFCWKH